MERGAAVSANDRAGTPESFFELLHTQRACRSFSDAAVGDTEIERILTAATFAPSTENRQPWVFVVVRDAQRRAAYGDLIKELWEQGAREYTRGSVSPALFRDVDAGLGEGGIAAAPVLIVVGGDTQRSHPSQIKQSVFPAIQNLLLAAHALGLGTCLTTITSVRADEVRRLADLPAHIEPVALIPVGVPARPLGPPRREAIATKTHAEQYGSEWPAE